MPNAASKLFNTIFTAPWAAYSDRPKALNDKLPLRPVNQDLDKLRSWLILLRPRLSAYLMNEGGKIKVDASSRNLSRGKVVFIKRASGDSHFFARWFNVRKQTLMY